MSKVQTQQYKVQGPDGTEHIIEGPAGASDDDIIAQAKILFPDHVESTTQPAAQPGIAPDQRTTSQVRSDQSTKVAEGFGSVFAHPYDNIIRPAIGLAADAAKVAADPTNIVPVAQQFAQGVKDAAGKFAPIANGAKYLVNELPEALQQHLGMHPNGFDRSKIPDATNQSDQEAAATLAGQNAGQIIAGEGAARGIGVATDAMEGLQASRAAKASADAVVRAKYPELYTKSIEPMAEAFGVKSSETRFKDFASNADMAMDEINKSSKDQFGMSPQNNRQQIEAGKTAMSRIYNTEIGPKVALVGDTDLHPLAEQLKAQIPDSFSTKERAIIERGIDDQLNTTLSGTDMEKLRQKFSAADRVAQAANNYVGSALYKTPRGYLFKAMDMGLRDYLANAVDKVQPGQGTAIKDALQRYGAVTDITQQAGGIPVDKSVADLITGRAYITGTTPNITGRVVEAATKKWYANDNLVRRAYAKYSGPVQRPTVPNTSVSTLAGSQQDLIPNQEGMFQPGVPNANGTDPGAGLGYGTHGQDTQGNLFSQPMMKGPTIDQSLPLGRRMQESMPSNAPVNPMESLVPHQQPVTAMTPLSTPIDRSVHVQARPLERPVNPMPAESMSTKINRQALYGASPAQAQLTNGPFQFELKGKPPIEVKIGSAAETPRVVQSTSDTTGSMANQYPPNWQLDSTTRQRGLVDGQQQTINSGGSGNLITTDPKVVENTIAAIQKQIIDKRPRGAKLTELQATRDDLLKQLQQYRAQKGLK